MKSNLFKIEVFHSTESDAIEMDVSGTNLFSEMLKKSESDEKLDEVLDVITEAINELFDKINEKLGEKIGGSEDEI